VRSVKDDPAHKYSAALFAQELLGFEPDEHQKRVLDAMVRRGILNCTRQWGKTTVTSVKALHRAWHVPRSLVVVASPSARQSSIFLRRVREFAVKLGVRPRGDGENEISLLLPNGSRIVGLPDREDTTRGFSNPAMLLIDEAARVSEATYDALLPMLATGNGQLWLMSTPNGRRGFFWQEWTRGSDLWTRISVKATECERISGRFLEEERRRKGDRVFRQEYLCEFVDADGSLFRSEDLEASVCRDVPALWDPYARAGEIFNGNAVKTTLLERRPRFYIGVDLGQSQDYTAVAVVERDELVFPERDPVTYAFRKETRFHLRFAERVPLGAPYAEVADYVKALVKRAPLAGNSVVVVDGTGVGAPVVELLSKGKLGCRVMAVVITAGDGETSDGARHRVPKRDLMGGLQVAFERRRLRVAPGIGAFDDLMDELRWMRVRTSADGRERISGKRHDDLVLALALAWWRACRETGW
jgi:hypothetical protein